MIRLVTLASLIALAVPVLAAAPGRVADEKATKADYDLDVGATETKVKAGGEGKFSLVFRPKNGKKVHPEAPLEVSFKNPKGVKPAKVKLGRSDVVDKGSKAPEVRTTFRTDKPGSYTLDATVSFFLCTDAWCQRMTDRVSVPITVE